MKSSNATTSSACNTSYNNPTLPPSSFLNLPQPRPPPPPPPTSSSFFDPLPSYFPAFQYSPSNPNPSPSSSAVPPQQQQQQQQQQPPPPPPQQQPSRPSSSKKRSRASRRAPTTVLTTDTSNFRAMVQEFTGFPAPPFASPSSASSPYSFLSRPFPQKQLPTPSQSLADAIAATAAAGGGAAAFPLFASNPGLIGIHGSVLGPPRPPPPQYGDLGGFVAAAPSEGVLEQGHESHAGRPWQELGGEGGGGGDRQEKRQKAAGDGVAESWIHSSE